MPLTRTPPKGDRGQQDDKGAEGNREAAGDSEKVEVGAREGDREKETEQEKEEESRKADEGERGTGQFEEGSERESAEPSRQDLNKTVIQSNSEVKAKRGRGCNRDRLRGTGSRASAFRKWLNEEHETSSNESWRSWEDEEKGGEVKKRKRRNSGQEGKV